MTHLSQHPIYFLFHKMANIKVNNEEISRLISIFVLLLGGYAILGWQIYEYLRFDTWPAVSVLTALKLMGISWATNPMDWAGLHRILNAISLPLMMILFGWIILISD